MWPTPDDPSPQVPVPPPIKSVEAAHVRASPTPALDLMRRMPALARIGASLLATLAGIAAVVAIAAIAPERLTASLAAALVAGAALLSRRQGPGSRAAKGRGGPQGSTDG